jgi:hypothetical protein
VDRNKAKVLEALKAADDGFRNRERDRDRHRHGQLAADQDGQLGRARKG